MNRERVFSAILHNNRIVMVKVEDKGRTYWSLPGGGVEKGEVHEDTAVREVWEEVNLKVKVIRYLFEKEYSAGTEYCYLAEPIDGYDLTLTLGHDPELSNDKQVLTNAEWREISEVCDDLQVAQVLKTLKLNELIKYKIDIP